MGLLSKIDMVSAVSGGSWAASIFMFADMELSELLGSSSDPSLLNLDALKQQPPPLASVALAHTNRILVRLLAEGVPGHMVWVSAIAEAILKPFGLDDLGAYMAPDEQAVQRIIARNPQLQGRAFLVPQPCRPKVLVMGGVVEAPDGYRASARNVVSLQMSPDFSGTPFVPNDTSVSYEASPGTHRPPLEDVLVGGGLVETFAFGGQEPSEGQSGGDAVRLQAPLTPLSLARAVGISSAAFGAAASRASLAGVGAGAQFDPQLNLWPVTSSKHPGPRPAMTFQLGDGSNLDNTGLIAALQRGASKVIALINADSPFRGDERFCSPPPWPDPMGAVTAQLLDKFGYAASGGNMGFFGNNRVFAEDQVFPLLCELSRLQGEGLPLVAKQTLTVEANAWWGLRGGAAVEVAFVLLGKSTRFEALLPNETMFEIEKGETGSLDRFPNYRTIFQNSDLTALNAGQVNILAALGEFSLLQNEGLIGELLE